MPKMRSMGYAKKRRERKEKKLTLSIVYLFDPTGMMQVSHQMTDVITGTVKQSHLSTTSCSLLMFMSITCSSKVVLQMTLEGSRTTSGPIYKDLQIGYGGITREKIMRRYLIGVFSTMDHDQQPQYQRVPSSTTLCVHPQEALGFVIALLVINQDTITKPTTNQKPHMTQIHLA